MFRVTSVGVVLSLLRFVSCQSYQLHDIDSTVLIGASSACLSAYNANVSCPTEVGWLYGTPYQNFDLSTLETLCSDSCSASIRSHRANIASACAQSVYYLDPADNTSYVPTALDDVLSTAYQVACAKRSDGSYCNLWYQSLTNSTAAASECDECVLQTAQLQASSPEGQDDETRSSYSSLTSSCHATNYPTTAAPNAVVTSTTAPSKTCAGSMYTLSPTDSFHSVPQSQGVSTEQLLSSNGLSYDVSAFPKTGVLCIENKCETHVIQSNETCIDIAASSNVTVIQLISWNANLDLSNCNNLTYFVDDAVCLSNPKGNFAVSSTSIGQGVSSTTFATAAPQPTQVGSNVTTSCGEYYTVEAGHDCQSVTLKFGISFSDFRLLNPGIDAECSNLWLDYAYCVAPVGSIATYSGYTGTAVPPSTTPAFTPGPSTSQSWDVAAPTADPQFPIIPLANGTRVDCYQYMWINASQTDPSAMDCWGMASSAGVGSEEFALWNPSIDQNADEAESPSYDYSCTLAPSVSYCMSVASPSPAPPTQKAPPTPRAAGEISGCINWDVVNDPLPCDAYMANLGMTLADFYKMNPSVNSDCSGLYLGTYYCIATPDLPNYVDGTQTTAPSTTTATSSAGGNGVATPTPYQSGMTKSCKTFHKVISGDGCYDIASASGISLDDFYAWNPDVGTDCHDLELNTYVCIGLLSSSMTTTTSSTTQAPTKTTTSTPASTKAAAPGPTQAGIASNCNKYVMQKDGVYCYDMAAAADITLDQLYAWNPALNGDCSGLWAGYAYCIGISS